MRTERRRPATWCARCCRRIRSARSTRANLLSQPMSEGHRVEMLNRTAGNLVAGEVLQSLWNPSSRVRDGALLTLSRNSEKAADPALLAEVIRLLDIPELGMQGDGGADARQARNPRGRPRPGRQAEFGGPDAGSGRPSFALGSSAVRRRFRRCGLCLPIPAAANSGRPPPKPSAKPATGGTRRCCCRHSSRRASGSAACSA